jgi:predicted molibdopterin-dependent oxidoreductase YjgC
VEALGFKRRGGEADITVHLDDAACRALAGDSVASLLLTTPNIEHRKAAVSGSARAPHCMIGVCFECLVEIDGRPYQRACLTPLCAGMRIRRQNIVQDEAWS